MPISVPVATKSPGDILTSSAWNSQLRDNINKLLNTGHRQLTVAQFIALTPEIGDEAYVQVDATNFVYWHFVYVDTTIRWAFIGGPPLFSEVATSESTSSTTYAALTTAGPAIGLPRSGDYDVETGFYGPGGDAAAGAEKFMSYDIGGTGAVDADAVRTRSDTATTHANPMRKRRKQGLTPVTLTAKYKNTTAAAATFANRFMSVTPVRIRHDA